MSALDQLLDMGFPKDKAEHALNCNSNNFAEAMEWLLVHGGDEQQIIVPEEPKTSSSSSEVKTDESLSENKEVSGDEAKDGGDGSGNQEAKSIKCEDCGRLFKTQLEVEFHATKSGHMNFSESTEEKKPLTEEEKKAQLALIEEKMKRKRAEREEKEKQEALDRERVRIKSGKDLTEVRRKMEEDEMKKIVEQRKREKQEEKLARERVKAQIEADKAARRAKLADPAAPQPVAVAPSTSQVISSPSPIVTKDYKETKIQIRLPNGTTLVETFDKNEQLSAVRLFVQLKQGDEPGTFPFGMMTSFPRKVFDHEDFGKSLEMLQLVPSATIIVTKQP